MIPFTIIFKKRLTQCSISKFLEVCFVFIKLDLEQGIKITRNSKNNLNYLITKEES